MIPSLVTLTDKDFDSRDFRNHCIVGVRFIRCRIRRTDFSGADLSYAVFEDCDLYEARFVNAVLYTCRFYGCDVTKADFSSALLNGIRVKDTDVTHTVFGPAFDVGKNRKWTTRDRMVGNILCTKSLTRMEHPIRSVEEDFDGIFCEDTGHAIQFTNDPDDQTWRQWRRRSEVAKTVERLLSENGYKDRSLDVYFLYRYYDTRADQSRIRRFVKQFLLEWIWGYGIKILRPVLAWAIVILFFALIYGISPLYDATAGLTATDVPLRLYESGKICWGRIADFLVFSGQLSTLSVYGNLKPVGAAKFIALLHQVISLVIVGLGVATITRRIGNV